MKNLIVLLCFCFPVMAQDPLRLPDGQPIAMTPVADGVWLFYQDGSAALVEPGGLVRQTITVSPQVLKTVWKDRNNMTHEVETDCRNITIEECRRRHREAVDGLAAIYAPV